MDWDDVQNALDELYNRIEDLEIRADIQDQVLREMGVVIEIVEGPPPGSPGQPPDKDSN